MMRFALILVLGIVFATSASARMYVWVSGQSGSVEMSGTPPAWYRSDLGGPRIQVFENGSLIDDTAIALSARHDEELRDAAFIEFEQRKQAEAIKRLERAARRERLRMEEADRLGEFRSEESEEFETAKAEADPEELPEELDQSMIDRLKNIINQWDSQPPEPQP